MEKQESGRTSRDYTEEEILQEIAPIFKDYFVARFRQTKEGLSMKLPNGQKFLIYVVKA